MADMLITAALLYLDGVTKRAEFTLYDKAQDSNSNAHLVSVAGQVAGIVQGVITIVPDPDTVLSVRAEQFRHGPGSNFLVREDEIAEIAFTDACGNRMTARGRDHGALRDVAVATVTTVSDEPAGTYSTRMDGSYYVGEDGRSVFRSPERDANGRISLGFRLCVVDEFVEAGPGEPSPAQQIADLLNAAV